MNDKERELNVRLAQWCWPDQTISVYTITGYIAVGWNRSEGWMFKGTFTRSLDAQAQHLWPKLVPLGWRLTLEHDLEVTDDGPVLYASYIQNAEEIILGQVFDEASPALACAEAIDAAIRIKSG